MNVYITNVSKFDISVREKTLKPGKGDVFPEEASKKDGVVAFARKGWLKVEMIKESPGGVGVAVGTRHGVSVEKKAKVEPVLPDIAVKAEPAPTLPDITATEDSGQKSEVGGQKSEVDGQAHDAGRKNRNKNN